MGLLWLCQSLKVCHIGRKSSVLSYDKNRVRILIFVRFGVFVDSGALSRQRRYQGSLFGSGSPRSPGKGVRGEGKKRWYSFLAKLIAMLSKSTWISGNLILKSSMGMQEWGTVWILFFNRFHLNREENRKFLLEKMYSFLLMGCMRCWAFFLAFST